MNVSVIILSLSSYHRYHDNFVDETYRLFLVCCGGDIDDDYESIDHHDASYYDDHESTYYRDASYAICRVLPYIALFDKDHTSASDVYSIGIIMAKLETPPFSGYELISKISTVLGPDFVPGMPGH
nr:2798_t:CDS:2 [Entrophospora candida]